MKSPKTGFSSMDEYIAAFPEDIQKKLKLNQEKEHKGRGVMAWPRNQLKILGFAALIIGLPGLWLGLAAVGEPATVQEKIDWPAFMAGHDLMWTRLPGAYG